MLSTTRKIWIARYLSAGILFLRGAFGQPSEVRVRRRGLNWLLNLREGIDLSIYLLGGFEIGTLRRYAQLVKAGDVVLDIGANCGSHTLPLAQLVGPSGSVLSFEPTAYAFAKQEVNISLNPALKPRIRSHQMMLVAEASDPLPDSVYSSWPMEAAEDLHSGHRGRRMSTQGSLKATLDDSCAAPESRGSISSSWMSMETRPTFFLALEASSRVRSPASCSN